MTLILFITVWMFIGMYSFVQHHTKYYDITLGESIVFLFCSALVGPIVILIILIIDNGDRVVFKKKENKQNDRKYNKVK